MESFSETTTVRLYSEQPCAMAVTLTLALASAEKRMALTPGVAHIACPTAARMHWPGISRTSWMRPERSSRLKWLLSASTAVFAWWLFTAKQIECSEDACEIITTFTCASFIAWKTLDAVPGTPTMPVPSTLIMETSSIVAKPFTVRVRKPLAFVFAVQVSRVVMDVPGFEILKKLRITTGMFFFIAGMVHWGCSTLAPKYDNSQAS
mmetsp:Transcript_23836/g.39968  ORF Transcript_23836/g.39968 Transcript_23836/m.39968 type:complete len:207 (-) Transcript_23836:1194-1814(-)